MTMTPEQAAQQLEAEAAAVDRIHATDPAFTEKTDLMTFAEALRIGAAAIKRNAEHEQFRHQHRDCDAMALENQQLRIALLAAERIAVSAHAYWDSDNDSKVGKLLIAMLTDTLNYSADCTLFRAAIGAIKAKQT